MKEKECAANICLLPGAVESTLEVDGVHKAQLTILTD